MVCPGSDPVLCQAFDASWPTTREDLKIKHSDPCMSKHQWWLDVIIKIILSLVIRCLI